MPVPCRILRYAATEWVAAVTLGSRVIATPKCRTRKAAMAALEPALREAGYARTIPEWAPLPTEVMGAPAPAPTVPAPAPEPEPVPVPAPEPVPSAKDLRDDAAEAAIEDAKRILPPVLPKMEGGFVTPRSDLAAWLDVFEQVCEKLEPVFEQDPDVRQRAANFREGVNLAMEGISFKGAYRRTIGGDFWVRHAQSLAKQAGRVVIDPTSRVIVARKPATGRVETRNGVPLTVCPADGPRWTKNINGNWIQADGTTERREAREAAAKRAAIPGSTIPERAEIAEAAARAAAATRAPAPAATADLLAEFVRDDATKTWRHRETGAIPRRETRRLLNQAAFSAQQASARSERPRYEGDPAAMRSAVAYGRSMAAAYQAAGLRSALGYKLGVVVALRGMGAMPHPEYDSAIQAEIGTEALDRLVSEFAQSDALSA